MRAKRAEDLPLVVVEITILDPSTCDHNHIDWLSEIAPNSAKDLAQSPLNLITEGCPLLYLRCNGYREATLFSL